MVVCFSSCFFFLHKDSPSFFVFRHYFTPFLEENPSKTVLRIYRVFEKKAFKKAERGKREWNPSAKKKNRPVFCHFGVDFVIRFFAI